MLDAWIIEELKKQEQQRREKYDGGRRIWQEIPLPPPYLDEKPVSGEKEPDSEIPSKIVISMVKGYFK
ncbi:MAG TPA: hypothetical protein VJH68_02235 [Candidatus Nanoarchaeia archaeon]|nr:hypothetical protein [Candidatus Nanoarchaeia archaeon]